MWPKGSNLDQHSLRVAFVSRSATPLDSTSGTWSTVVVAEHGSAPSERCCGSRVVESDPKAKEVAALFERWAPSDGFGMHVFSSRQRASADNAPPLPVRGLGAVVAGAGLVDGGEMAIPGLVFLPQFLVGFTVVWDDKLSFSWLILLQCFQWMKKYFWLLREGVGFLGKAAIIVLLFFSSLVIVQ